MKQKMLVFLSFIGLAMLLIGINAASYTKKDRERDLESHPNRSSYNTGSTGTRAFYDLLAETGQKVTRWQEPPSSLLISNNAPQTFVIVGTTRLEIENEEAQQILHWVSEGGTLVIIDRAPVKELLLTTANWSISTIPGKNSIEKIDPSEQMQMTLQTPALKPSQPSILTRNINAVQPSRFASSVKLNFLADQVITTSQTPEPAMTPIYTLPSTPRPTPMPTINTPAKQTEEIEIDTLNAPFVHISNDQQNILVDFPYYSGNIIYLTDPYIVSNAGIKLVDNAQLAVNVVSSRQGLIAFDEFHQGYGANRGSIFGYLAGTPVLPIFGQIFLLIAIIFWSQSRRFARPLPANEPNRLSKLEYVSAMATLQQKTRAYDLAVENIFSQFRRSVTRFLGMDNFTTPHKELAQAISERLKTSEMEIYNLMRKCEDIIQGQPTNKRQVLELTSRLREIENQLGLKRSRKQAFRK